MSYWDIESFLAEDQLVEFCFTEDADGMQFLDPSKGIMGPVPAETPLKSPIWVVSTLRDYVFKEDGEVVRVVVPKFLDKEKENEYHAVETDRRAKLQNMNLREKSIYFFRIYAHIYKIFEKNPNIIEMDRMVNILASRAASIMERAATHQEQTKAESKFHGYIEAERDLFRVMRCKNSQYERWECRKF